MEVLQKNSLSPVKHLQLLVKKNAELISGNDKKNFKAKIDALDFSVHSRHLPNSFVKIYGSCVGRDFKLWAQIAVFILDGLISKNELQVWLYISEVRNNVMNVHTNELLHVTFKPVFHFNRIVPKPIMVFLCFLSIRVELMTSKQRKILRYLTIRLKWKTSFISYIIIIIFKCFAQIVISSVPVCSW